MLSQGYVLELFLARGKAVFHMQGQKVLWVNSDLAMVQVLLLDILISHLDEGLFDFAIGCIVTGKTVVFFCLYHFL